MVEIQKSHYLNLRKRVLGSLILSITVFILSMFYMDWAYSNYLMLQRWAYSYWDSESLELAE
jgi:hypothetical protein